MDENYLYDDLDQICYVDRANERNDEEYRELNKKYEQSLDTIQKLQKENKELQKRNKILECNFKSLIETVRAEMKRKDAQIDLLRKEKDNLCFRRANRVKPNEETFLQNTRNEVVRMAMDPGFIDVNNDNETPVQTFSQNSEHRSKEPNRRLHEAEHRRRDDAFRRHADYRRYSHNKDIVSARINDWDQRRECVRRDLASRDYNQRERCHDTDRTYKRPRDDQYKRSSKRNRQDEVLVTEDLNSNKDQTSMLISENANGKKIEAEIGLNQPRKKSFKDCDNSRNTMANVDLDGNRMPNKAATTESVNLNSESRTEEPSRINPTIMPRNERFKTIYDRRRKNESLLKPKQVGELESEKNRSPETAFDEMHVVDNRKKDEPHELNTTNVLSTEPLTSKKHTWGSDLDDISEDDLERSDAKNNSIICKEVHISNFTKQQALKCSLHMSQDTSITARYKEHSKQFDPDMLELIASDIEESADEEEKTHRRRETVVEGTNGEKGIGNQLTKSDSGRSTTQENALLNVQVNQNLPGSRQLGHENHNEERHLQAGEISENSWETVDSKLSGSDDENKFELISTIDGEKNDDESTQDTQGRLTIVEEAETTASFNNTVCMTGGEKEHKAKKNVITENVNSSNKHGTENCNYPELSVNISSIPQESASVDLLMILSSDSQKEPVDENKHSSNRTELLNEAVTSMLHKNQCEYHDDKDLVETENYDISMATLERCEVQQKLDELFGLTPQVVGEISENRNEKKNSHEKHVDVANFSLLHIETEAKDIEPKIFSNENFNFSLPVKQQIAQDQGANSNCVEIGDDATVNKPRPDANKRESLFSSKIRRTSESSDIPRVYSQDLCDASDEEKDKILSLETIMETSPIPIATKTTRLKETRGKWKPLIGDKDITEQKSLNDSEFFDLLERLEKNTPKTKTVDEQICQQHVKPINDSNSSVSCSEDGLTMGNEQTLKMRPRRSCRKLTISEKNAHVTVSGSIVKNRRTAADNKSMSNKDVKEMKTTETPNKQSRPKERKSFLKQEEINIIAKIIEEKEKEEVLEPIKEQNSFEIHKNNNLEQSVNVKRHPRKCCAKNGEEKNNAIVEVNSISAEKPSGTQRPVQPKASSNIFVKSTGPSLIQTNNTSPMNQKEQSKPGRVSSKVNTSKIADSIRNVECTMPSKDIIEVFESVSVEIETRDENKNANEAKLNIAKKQVEEQIGRKHLSGISKQITCKYLAQTQVTECNNGDTTKTNVKQDKMQANIIPRRLSTRRITNVGLFSDDEIVPEVEKGKSSNELGLIQSSEEVENACDILVNKGPLKFSEKLHRRPIAERPSTRNKTNEESELIKTFLESTRTVPVAPFETVEPCGGIAIAVNTPSLTEEVFTNKTAMKNSPIVHKDSSICSLTDAIDQRNVTLNSSYEKKNLSMASSDYLIETVSDNVVNVFVKRKKVKKKRNM